MNIGTFSLLKKTLLFSGALFLAWTAQAQSTGNSNGSNNMQSDTARHKAFHQGPGSHQGFHGDNGQGDMGLRRQGERGVSQGDRGFGARGFGERGRGERGFRGREGWAGRGPAIRYTPEQRRQVMAINKEYHQKSEDLFKNDNSTLKEYKAGLIALQKEKAGQLEALLTQKQKDERTARTKRMSENTQVMAAARMERLKLRLNLSDDQVAKIKADQADLHRQVKAIHENDNLLPQQKRQQMKDLMAKQKDVVKSVLTPEQQTQFEKMSHRRPGPGGFGGPGFQHRHRNNTTTT